MSIVVQKFGGSSVADAHHIFNVAKKVTSLYSQGHDIVVVVSAQGDTTDLLLKKAYEINTNASKRELDTLLSAGEQISISLLCMAIQKLGFSAISLTGWQAKINTNSVCGNATITNINTEKIKKELKSKKIVVVAGFQGIDDNENITTLGRGGSDTSAVALASALNADLCKIYTDVDGVYTADPRIVSTAKKIKTISYNEMYTLSSFGAQVLSDKSIETAKENNVKIEVLSSMSDNTSGTMVMDIPTSKHHISGISILNNLATLTISDINDVETFYKSFVLLLKEKNLYIDTALKKINNSASQSISFSVEEKYIPQILEILESEFKEHFRYKTFYEKNKSKISVINLSDSANINIASIIFETLYEMEIEVEMIACTQSRVSVIISSQHAYESMNAIHCKLFEEDNLI